MKKQDRKIIRVWERMSVAYSRDIVGDLFDGFTVDPNLFPGRTRYFPRVFWTTVFLCAISLVVSGYYALSCAALAFALIGGHVFMCRCRDRELMQWPEGFVYQSPSWTPQLLKYADKLADRLLTFQWPQRAAADLHGKLSRRRQQYRFERVIPPIVGMAVFAPIVVTKMWLAWEVVEKATILAAFGVPVLVGYTAGFLAYAALEAESSMPVLLVSVGYLRRRPGFYNQEKIFRLKHRGRHVL